MSSFLSETSSIPIIDISPLLTSSSSSSSSSTTTASSSLVSNVEQRIGDACRHVGFFYIVGHGVPKDLIQELESLSHKYFALPLEEKQRIDMKFGGKAWRGYFAVGDEVTSGIPDQKEGLYFGTEGSLDDPRYLHGLNQWPIYPSNPQDTERYHDLILFYMQHMRRLGTLLMIAIMNSLQLPRDVMQGEMELDRMFKNPTELFRIFNYPPHDTKFGEDSFGVGEHTDYGYITILKQDNSGGLQVKRVTANEDDSLTCTWIDAPPIEDSFVINIGDALERMSGGLYRATPHRVQRRVGAVANRLSFPFFFDPDFDALMTDFSPYLQPEDKEIARRNMKLVVARWDKADPSQFNGTYGQYLLRKVSKVFPELAAGNLN